MAATRDAEVADADQAPTVAALGSLVDHLFAHAASDGYELDLLERASGLWSRGLELYTALSDFRTQLEALLADPSDTTALQTLKSSYESLESQASDVQDLLADLQALRHEVAEVGHLVPHPRQQDLEIHEWGWGEIFLARRTEAFVREARRQVVDQETSAFAFGCCPATARTPPARPTSPRSSAARARAPHPQPPRALRSRQLGRSLGPFRPLLRHARRPARRSLPIRPPGGPHRVHPVGRRRHIRPPAAAAVPDLEEGYRRLVRHLRLLDAFSTPDAPRPPGEPFLSRLYGDPSAPYVPSMPEQTGLIEAGEQPGTISTGTLMPQSNSTKDDGPTHSEPPGSTEVKCGEFWEALGVSLLFLLGGWIACVIRWADGDRCPLWDEIEQSWSAAFPSGVQIEGGTGAAQGLTAAGAENIAQSPQISQFVGDLHNLQCLMWDGFHKAYEFLAVFGLVYPDGLLGRWRYRQYLAIPEMEWGTWPLLPETGPRFDEYPGTGVELPATDFGYLQGTTPATVLSPVPQAGVTSAAELSMVVWEQIAMGVQDSSNLDLDADRGWRFPCWATDGPIDSQPVGVRMLAYDEV